MNDPGRLISVHLMHTALVSGWAGSMALYELAIFDPSDLVLNPSAVCWYFSVFLNNCFRNNSIFCDYGVASFH